MSLGIALALVCAVITNVALLCKYRGAVAAPPVDMRRPLASAAALFRSRWWAIGFAVAVAAWIAHVAALALAPLSVVETVVSGGLVMLAFVAQRWFGIRIGRRELAGLILSAAGLALLGATAAGAAGNPGSGYSTSAMIYFESGAVGIGALLLLSGTGGSTRDAHGPLLGIAAGLLLGVANVSVKALTDTVPGDPLTLLGPWTLVALMAGIGAFFALARGMQTGDAIPVIALTSVAANCSSILGGILVFGDSMGTGTVAIVARSLAFAAVIGAVALLPAPSRAARATA